MNRTRLSPLLVAAFAIVATHVQGLAAEEPLRLPASCHNLLLSAKVTGNLESYQKGLRGAPDHMIWDPATSQFARPSQYHEYGVGFNQDLGVIPEAQPAWWMAEWPQAIEANLIVLSGVYPNQPQPQTAWKIELRRDGQWTEHARGVGGWYDRGRYVWGGPGTQPIYFDAIRVSLFSPDAQTPIKSIHFRGEENLSWVVVNVGPIDATIRLPRPPLRATREVTFGIERVVGQVATYKWEFGDGATAEGATVTHAFAKPAMFHVKLFLSDGRHTATVSQTVEVLPPIEVSVVPLTKPVMAGEIVRFEAQARLGNVREWKWDFGDGQTAQGQSVEHTFTKPGTYHVRLTASDGTYSDDCLAIVRAHTAETLRVPQVVLDTDQKNEQDDQHYFGYALFSQLDILGVNSVHHGGGQEPINYGELVHVLDLAKQSGLPEHRAPFLFHGANQRLSVPASQRWDDTLPIVTEASEAILAAVRGASPSNPVWVVPVGPGTNVASAILQARDEGLDLKGRLRVMWLGGSNTGIINEFNGNNDPWAMYVVAQSGLETWIMPAPVGARVAIDKRTEGDLYANHPLGQYLKEIVPARNKPLYDPSCLAAIIGLRLNLGWVKETEYVTVAGPSGNYQWTGSETPTSVRVIREIDQQAMRQDIFDTMKGTPTKLIGAP